MMATLGKYLGQFLVTYILPYLFKEAQEIVIRWGQNVKLAAAKKKASKEANKEHDAVINNPASTIEEKIRADRDLINNSGV